MSVVEGNMLRSTDPIEGILDMLILQAPTLEPNPGLGIAQRAQKLSLKVLSVRQGSPGPELGRQDYKSWIDASRQSSVTPPCARGDGRISTRWNQSCVGLTPRGRFSNASDLALGRVAEAAS